jgi:hypothetical protein
MAILTKVITASVGFVFTLGAFGKASAREPGPGVNGTVVMARETRSSSMGFSSVDALRKQLTELAASKDNDTRRKNTKNKTKTTKKEPRSPKKPTKGQR